MYGHLLEEAKEGWLMTVIVFASGSTIYIGESAEDDQLIATDLLPLLLGEDNASEEKEGSVN